MPLRIVGALAGGLFLFMLPLALLAGAVYLAVRPEGLGWQARAVVAAVAGSFALVFVGWAAVQARATLEGLTTTTETDTTQGQSGPGRRQSVMLVHGLAGRVINGTTGVTLRVAGSMTAPLVALIGGAAVGIAPAPWSYLAAIILALLAVHALTRAAGAGKRVNVTTAEARRIFGLYGFPVLPAVVAAVAAAAVWGGLAIFAGSPQVALGAYLVIVAAGTVLGRRAVTALREETEDRGRLLAPLALALGATETELDGLHWRIAPDGQITITGRIPATILRHKGNYETQFAQHMPSYEVRDVTEEGITVRPVTETVLAQRQMLASTHGYVLAVEPLTPEEIY